MEHGLEEETREWVSPYRKRQPPRDYTKESTESEHERLRTRTKDVLKARKEEGHTPSEKLWEKSRETHFTTEKVRSIKSDRWNGVRTKGRTDMTAGLLLSSRRVSNEERTNKRTREIWRQNEGKNGESKRTGMSCSSHCALFFPESKSSSQVAPSPSSKDPIQDVRS